MIRIVHSDRFGGVSEAPFHSLNLSFRVGDDPDSVIENRRRFKEQLHVPRLLSAGQVHSDALFIADTPLPDDLEVTSYDALLTNQTEIGLFIQQADCQAVTLFDPLEPAIAAIHCGWKGSVLNILAKTVAAMEERYNSSPSRILAAISPSLGPCCAEFIHHSTELLPSFLAFQCKENYFDFWQISKMQLLEAGLTAENICINGHCTSCSEDFFSYRRSRRRGNGVTGRCGTGIVLTPSR